MGSVGQFPRRLVAVAGRAGAARRAARLPGCRERRRQQGLELDGWPLVLSLPRPITPRRSHGEALATSLPRAPWRPGSRGAGGGREVRPGRRAGALRAFARDAEPSARFGPALAPPAARNIDAAPSSLRYWLALQVRGPKKHLKRLNAPHHWMTGKLGGIYAPKVSAGPHKSRECLPMVIIVRNRMKYALTRTEAQAICMQKLVRPRQRLFCCFPPRLARPPTASDARALGQTPHCLRGLAYWKGAPGCEGRLGQGVGRPWGTG